MSAAVAAGEVSGDHANVIIAATREIPGSHEGRFDDLVETTLVDQARHAHPGQVQKAAAVLLQRLDPDGRAPMDEEHQRRREFGLRPNADGSHTPFGRLTPDCGAVWNTILDSLAKPQPAEDGTPDPRSAGQRGHDAFHDAGQRLLRADLPDTGGTPITLMVTMHLDDLQRRTGTGTGTARPAVATSVDSGAQHRPQLTTQAAMAGSSSRSVDGSGTTERGTREGADCDGRRPRQRDRTRPRAPAAHQAHHVTAWQALGPTDIDNLTLLCGYHHRNFEALGWSCHMNNGIPMWTPPAWLDPEQRPRRNTAHHLDIDFDTG